MQKAARHKKERIDLSVGGEGREESHRSSQMDVWNRSAHNLWRSDAAIPKAGYNESDAASEVSWVIVVSLRQDKGPTQ